MATAKVEFHRLARKEYDNARLWYAERSENAAARFKKAVDDAITRISQHPNAWPRYSGVDRWVRVRRFPYIVVFREREPNLMVVVAVAHTSRRPSYWRHRK
jgi:plasmid stabilization system protein ParE